MLVGALTAGAVAAQTSSKPVLDNSGTVYRVLTGTQTELFRFGIGYEDRKLLALDVSRGAETDRLVVPNSVDAVDITSPLLVHLAASDSMYLLWESRLSWLHSQFNLIAYNPMSGWSSITELSGRPFQRKLQPSVVPYSDGSDELARTFVQVIWRDERGSIYYVPSAVSEGTELSTGAPTDLSEMFGLTIGEGAGYDLAVERAAHRGGTWIGRLDRGTGWIDLLQAHVVPTPLSTIAEELASTLLAADPSATLEDLRGSARATIVNIGRTIEPALAELLAAEIDERLAQMQESLSAGDLESIAGDARATIVNIGARIERGGFTQAAPSSAFPWAFLRVEEHLPERDAVHYAVLSQSLQTQVPASFPLADAELLVARDGLRLMVFQTSDEGDAQYATFEAGQWGETQVLRQDATVMQGASPRDLLVNLLNR
jgi:hypothetical protein